LHLDSVQDIIRLVSNRVLKCCRLTHGKGIKEGRDKVKPYLKILRCLHGNSLGGVYYVGQDKDNKLKSEVRRGQELVSPCLCDHVGVRHAVLDLFSPLSHMDEILADCISPNSTMICLKYLANRGRYVRNNTLRWLYLDFKSPPEYFCAQSKR
jgi:hypothetical protein